MNHTIAVAKRELVEKRFVLTVPLGMALVVFLLPLAPRVPAHSWQTIYVLVASIMATAFAIGVSVMLGATTVGRELTDKRLSFYFAKPVNAPAIWFGKLVASAILVVLSFAIAMIPALFAGTKAGTKVWGGKGWTFLIPLAIIVTTLFFLAHVLSTITRARSAWILLDLAAFLVLGFAGWTIVQPLIAHSAFAMIVLVVEIFAWLALIAVIAAGAWQLEFGRTERAQSHLAMSRFLWPALAVAMAICGGVVAWVVSVSPTDLMAIRDVHLPARGEYVAITGEAAHRRDYRPMFVVNTRTGAFSRLDTYPIAFTRDGSKMILHKPIARISSIGEIVFHDLATGVETPTGLSVSQRADIAFSDDSNRVAYIADGILNVYDVSTKTSLGSIRFPQSAQAMWFAGPDTLRLYAVTPPNRGEVVLRHLHIFEYNVKARTMQETGGYEQQGKMLLFSANSDGSRLFVRTSDQAAMIDARSGAQGVTVPGARALFQLADGRLCARMDKSVRILSPDGTLIREIPIGDFNFWSVRPMGGSKLFVATRPEGLHAHSTLSVIDADSGATLRREEGLELTGIQQMFGDVRRVELNPDQVFLDRSGNLVRWNPITNEKNTIVNLAKG